jgi:GTP-sensing pleiotropic transcriptional regulator CodY
MTVKRSRRLVKKFARARAKAAVKSRRNGHVDVVSPATASEIRRTLGIRKIQIQNALRALEAAGVAI